MLRITSSRYHTTLSGSGPSRYADRMDEDTRLSVGDDVLAVAGARGTIVDIREMSNGETAYGVVDVNGAVRYYTAVGVKRLQP